MLSYRDVQAANNAAELSVRRARSAWAKVMEAVIEAGGIIDCKMADAITAANLAQERLERAAKISEQLSADEARAARENTPR